jgi:putative membrane protein
MMATDFIVRVQLKRPGGICKAHDCEGGGCIPHCRFRGSPVYQAQSAVFGTRHVSGCNRSVIKNLKFNVITTIKSKIILALGLSGMAAATALADDTASTNQPPALLTSQQFVSDAAFGGLKEVYLSEAALATSTNTDVQNFARHMVKDHRAANEKLAKIANDEGLSLPPTNTFSPADPTWSNPQVASQEILKGAQLLIQTNLPYRGDYLAVQNVKSLSGPAFDQAYASDMVSDHNATVSEFETASQSLSDAKLKKFADKTLPTLRHHTMLAQELNDKLNSLNGNSLTNRLISNRLPERPRVAPVP